MSAPYMEVVRGSASKNVRNLCSIKADNVGLHTECFGLNKLIYAFFFFLSIRKMDKIAIFQMTSLNHTFHSKI